MISNCWHLVTELGHVYFDLDNLSQNNYTNILILLYYGWFKCCHVGLCGCVSNRFFCQLDCDETSYKSRCVLGLFLVLHICLIDADINRNCKDCHYIEVSVLRVIP